MNTTFPPLLKHPKQEKEYPPLEHPRSKGTNTEYAELKRLLKNNGLLDKQPVYYLWRIALILALLTAGLVFLVGIHVVWLQLLDAVYLALVFGQIGLLSHEAGHHQMFHRTWKHALVGLVGGNLLIGMSYAWWQGKHNRHHSHPNQVGMDPDIEIPFLDFTGTQDLAQMSSFRQFLVKRQAFFLLPALMTVAIGLQANSVKFLWHTRTKYYGFECGLILAHFVLYFGLAFLCLGWWQALLFIGLHQALTGFYLGSIFAPNHKGMPVLEKDSPMDWLHRQVVTARNIHAHPLTDFGYGGLNYQIEHHLFPSMARNKLKQAQPLVKAFCLAHGIPYHETSVSQSFTEIFRHLHHIGAPLRRSSLPSGKDANPGVSGGHAQTRASEGKPLGQVPLPHQEKPEAGGGEASPGGKE